MNLLKSEWIKATSTKSAYWLYAIGIALAVLLAVIIGRFDQSATDPIAGEAGKIIATPVLLLLAMYPEFVTACTVASVEVTQLRRPEGPAGPVGPVGPVGPIGPVAPLHT